MNEADSKAIKFLLAAILCVMLFGASAVPTGIVWFAIIAGVLAIIAVVFIAIFSFISEIIPALAKLAVAMVKGLPKLPGHLARLVAWLVALPVLGPLRCWWSICERRTRGERVGSIAASFELLWAFVVSVILWVMVGSLVLLGTYQILQL